MSLTEIQIRKAKPGERLIKLSDGGGLQLWITPDGARRWRMAYRFEGKQKTLAIGVYPSVGLKDARAARESAKRLLADGRDPVIARKAAKAAQAQAIANTFDAVAAELIDKKRREGKAAQNARQVRMVVEARQSDYWRNADRRNWSAGSPWRAASRRSARQARNGEPASRDHWRSVSLRRRHGPRRSDPTGALEGRDSRAGSPT